MIDYPFSPIKDEEAFFKAAEYIVSQIDELAQKVLNQSLPINTVKVFAHYFDEYDYLYDLVSNMGEQAPFSSKTSYYAEVEMDISGHHMQYIGVRIVDPYRLHVGCGDYEIENYSEIRDEFLGKSKFVRDIRNGEMLELWHPDFDVLGYVVPPFED